MANEDLARTSESENEKLSTLNTQIEEVDGRPATLQ